MSMKNLQSNVRPVAVLAAIAGLVSALAGCQHLPGETARVNADFGNSARVVVRQQLADPEGSKNAGDALVVGLDGQKGGEVIRAYRGDNSTRDFGDAAVNTNSVTSGSN